VVEAARHGGVDHREHDWRLKRLRWRIEDRAVRGLIRQWRPAGLRERDGRGVHPDTGVPQGGGVAPG
jgi:hypothetical protein